jgi:nucleotide-binding universal stress UspA family protein
LVYLEHIARIENAKVTVLHVYQVPERYEATDGYEGLRGQFEVVAHEIVNDAVALLQERDVSAQGLVLAGDSAQMILETAMRQETTLIVMGTRGPSNITDVVLGDVSLEVLRNAHCPVLVVP